MTFSLGAHPSSGGIRFAVRSHHAAAMTLCLFDGDEETQVPLVCESDVWSTEVASARPGQRYGYRASGVWAPERGLWFDPSKLLVDPYATELDRRFTYDHRLGRFGVDTAALMPKAIVQAASPNVLPQPPFLGPGGLIYELNVRGFTMLHPQISGAQRGTVAALAHPATIAHFQKIGVAAIELMPIVAWIDERHLQSLSLTNGWGYNPVAMMALDPGLCPGGMAELRETVAALHAAGIGVILDLVFNHSGESDIHGPILSLRGIDAPSYFRTHDGQLVNDSGTGNTLACDQPAMRDLILDTLRHFAGQAGIDGFRFDLAPILARTDSGFDPAAPIFADIATDPLLVDRVMIAEPWDIGPGGYQLGRFPPNWLEWNDRYRDDVRRFWRGDAHAIGDLATRLAGSSDVFAPPASRSVNFIAAHDGFTLADCVAYEAKHNEANGEDNRDGHNENLSWNCGAEGPTGSSEILDRRSLDLKALLATLFASRGTIMLTAGDELGRTQRGNNNAYCQDNAITWIDWQGRDQALEEYVAELAVLRAGNPAIGAPRLLGDDALHWLAPDGRRFGETDWNDPGTAAIAMRIEGGATVLINRSFIPVTFADPPREVPARSVILVPGQEPA